MSITGQRARDLVAAYNNCLEKQIVAQGSGLPCEDEKLWKEVEELLKSGDARDTHCLGLDSFKIMEESLRSTVAPGSSGTPKLKAGLKGLARAFEVLEQAALNLYLGPWREEYQVVKMYSGIFTHYIKPVFSMRQIEQLFGLLGYKPCLVPREQLRLQPQKVSADSLDEVLRLACAFFVVRCECRLLMAALGKNSGQAQRELSVVRERQRGYSLQVAVDNIMKTVEDKEPLREVSEESDMDLYTAEQVNGEPKDMLVDETPRSLTWMPESNAANSDGLYKEQVYVSKHHSQLKNPSISSTTRLGSHYLESAGDKGEALSGSEGKTERFNGEAQRTQHCSCLDVKNLYLYTCTKCQTYHHLTCPMLKPCHINHSIEYVDNDTEQSVQMRAAASQRRGTTSPTLTSSSEAFSSLALHDACKSTHPIRSPLTYHNCCDLFKLDHKVLCFSCKVFHTEDCNETRICLTHHEAKMLGVCSNKNCSVRDIQVLCKYCGNEYCKECWYKRPLECICGQTFDFSSSV